MKKKTKVALAAVTELVGYELEFAWEYAKYIRGESFCVEEAACGLSQLEVDTVGRAVLRLQEYFRISRHSARRLMELAVAKGAAPEEFKKHLWRDLVVDSPKDCWRNVDSAMNRAQDNLERMGLNDIGDGLYLLIWEYIPVERIESSQATRELQTWQMMAQLIESRASGLRNGF